MNNRVVVLVINLLQDINIIRPLAYIAHRDLKKNVIFLVTHYFLKRDTNGVWKKELNEIANETNAYIKYYVEMYEVLHLLKNKTGVIISASESDLDAHKAIYDLFEILPSQFLKVTLQHGFECVGFLQSHDQNMAHGNSVAFAADIICGWCNKERLTSIIPSQLSKLIVTGPTLVLQSNFENSSKKSMGIVCENMHSSRLNTAGNFKIEFMDIFANFCKNLKKNNRRVTLRPHPAGQYMLKNNVILENNVEIENAPIYKVDLSSYEYGISAPSSILIDMILAKIPVAVWQDKGSLMDLGNYEGLTKITNLNEWIQFSKDAITKREYFIEKQEEFLKKQLMLVSQESVYKNYMNLLQLPN